MHITRGRSGPNDPWVCARPSTLIDLQLAPALLTAPLKVENARPVSDHEVAVSPGSSLSVMARQPPPILQTVTLDRATLPQ